MMARCETCRFWRLTEGVGDVGECRRYAPAAARSLDGFVGEAVVAIAHMLSVHLDVNWPSGIKGEATEAYRAALWPETSVEDGCGEHEPSQRDG